MRRIKNKNQVRTAKVIILTMIFVPLIMTFDPFTGLAGLIKPIPVFVSIEPQVTFVRRIGGDRVTVEALVLPGKSPETYSPTPVQMAKLAKSKLFFRIGVPFEELLIKRIENSAPHVQIVDTRKGITLRKMEAHYEGQQRYNDDDLSHGVGVDGADPHIWLSPVLVQKQAATICESLISIDPEGRQMYEENCRVFIKDLDALHQKIKQSLAPVRGGTIFVFHPSFGYFTDAYGLKQIAVEIEGKSPKGKDLSSFIKLAKKEKVRVVFVQPQFDQNAALTLMWSFSGSFGSSDGLPFRYLG